MEQLSKLNHDSLPKIIPTLSHTLLTNHLFSILINFLRFSILFLLFSMEAIFLIQKWDPIFHSLTLSCFILFFILNSHLSTPPPIYLVDFSCLKPPNSCRAPISTYLEHARMLDFFDHESVAFMAKVLNSSGQGQQTYLPPALHYIPPQSNFQEVIKEVRMVLFPVFEDLLLKTNLSPRDIDLLIVNCSGFCPSPSLTSIIVNKYSLKSDIKCYNISGMGCSASALSVDMAQNLLKIHKNSNAIILSMEILSTGWYPGKEQPMMVLNCLFRMGGAAILLTNKKEAKTKYKLLCSLRTQRAFDDKAYNSAIREEDSNGITGVTLSRDLLHVAGETLRSHITILGSSILPFMEKFRYGVSILRKIFIDKSCEIYVPNFKSVINHFCLPVSGKPVIREIGKGLKLGEREREAAMVTLHRFGNQSSSSLWYELAYMEGKDRVKKGDKVWQLGMGSGPKCNSLVWECIRPIVGEGKRGPWADSIDEYPTVAFDQSRDMD